MFTNEAKWIRMFDIQDITKHKKGFTIYKVISMLYPESCPQAVTKVTVWKRFNEFKSLHKDIRALHKSLKIKDQVPNFPTASYFKRFDEDVIQHRKELILGLLEYISQHSQLFTSNMFVKFFETSHVPNEDIVGDSDDDCTISDDTDSLSIVSSSMIQLTDDSAKVDEYPINLKLYIGELQLYKCELFGNSLGTDLIESEYICHADRFFELAAEIESMHKEFKVAWKHYMQGIYVLLKYGKEDKNTDRKFTAKFKLEKYFIRVEKLFYLNLYQDIKSYMVDNYGEPFTNVALSDLNNLHFEQLFDLQKFEPMYQQFDENELIIRAEIGSLPIINYPVSPAAIRNSPYDSEDFVLLANKYEHEQYYGAAYVNYKMAFVDVYKYLKSESKDLTYLLRNEKYVYRGDELVTTTDKELDKENTEIQHSFLRKHADLYNYKVIDLMDEETMIVINMESEQKFVVKVVQKAVGFNHNCLIFPKHVPYMTKLQRWHNTEDNIFLLFNYTSVTNIKDHLLKLTNSSEFDCDNDTKETDQYFQQSFNSDDFEFIDLPSGSSNIEESDEFDDYSCEPRIVPMSKIKKWTAQIVLAIERLHKCDVICSDLKLDDLNIDEHENILIDYKYKIGENRVFSQTDSNLMAPEVYTFEMITPAADWWSLGIILYELLIGTPISTIYPDGFYTYPIVKIPKFITQDAKSFIRQLLIFEPNMRLGAGGSDQVKSHPFFNTIKWQSLKGLY